MEDFAESFETSGDTTNVSYSTQEYNITVSGLPSGVQEFEEDNQGKAHLEQHVIDFNEYSSRSGWSALRIPAHVLKVDKGDYFPRIVSIGPFHHNDPGLSAMEGQKQRFRDRLLTRSRQPNLEESLKNAMQELEAKTRDWYLEKFEAINPDAFVEMMVLDGCFIVELLHSYEKEDVEEPVFKTRWMRPNIARDLLMLENQLPMFVLQKIFQLTTFERVPARPLNKLALEFFEPLRPGKDRLAYDNTLLEGASEYPHLLALFHSTFIRSVKKYQPLPTEKKEMNGFVWYGCLLRKKEKKEMNGYEKLPGKGWVHNAKTLVYAGVRFTNKSGNLLDVEFKNSRLKIPTLFIDDGTSIVLRNLIAYEQSNRGAEPYFSCLAVFLDSIVDTTDDVKILRDAGIIKQAKGGNEEVVHLFNSLTQELEIDVEDCYISKQIHAINCHCLRHANKARIRRHLSRLNLTNLNSTYVSVLLTIFFIFMELKNSLVL